MTNETDTISLATDLTVAWLANPNTRANPDDVPAFLASVHDALAKLSAATTAEGEVTEETRHEPAVTARKSLADPNFIISLIDGRSYKSLTRHLKGHGLTPDQYRDRYGLKASYPMVAPAYSQVRRETAKRLGLGRKPAPKVESAPIQEVPAPKARKGKGVAAAKAAAKAHLGGGA